LGEINPEQEKCMGKALRYCNELLTMINSLLEATRIEAGSVVVERQQVDLKTFLDELRSVYDIPLDKEPVLIWDYPSDLPVLETDGGKLKQILQNLINNALKLTSKGHVAISARLKEGNRREATGEREKKHTAHESVPHASLVTPPAFVEFKVADTGEGISQEALPVLFEMFREVNGPEMKVYGSIGLALHIVKTFTEILGGKVSVESKPDKGSIFTVTIPCLIDK
jgi:two-component system chemotaxis sensor kinase CheA